MSKRDPGISLHQMHDHAREALQLSQGKNRGDLDTSRVLALASIHLLEIVGEAASRISPDIRARHPEVPWTEIIGLRHRLVHGYDQVDLDVLWQILTKDLPPLVESLESVIQTYRK